MTVSLQTLIYFEVNQRRLTLESVLNSFDLMECELNLTEAVFDHEMNGDAVAGDGYDSCHERIRLQHLNWSRSLRSSKNLH